jgi:hypothetical protein
MLLMLKMKMRISFEIRLEGEELHLLSRFHLLDGNKALLISLSNYRQYNIE